MRQFIAALAILGMAASASAQTYPNKQITLIVPFAPGGSSDIIARIVAEDMSQTLGQRILIENVAGAGGSVGFSRLATAAPDGYTIGYGNAGTSAATYTLEKSLKYSPDSFLPLGIVAKTLPVIAIKNAFPAQDLKGFLDYARANPGKVTLGHAGVGSSNFLICKLFLQAAKVQIELIGYRGAGPALNDAMGGHIDGVCDGATSVAGAINNKQIRGLLISAKARADILPDVPTSIEAGLPEFVQEGWSAFFAPKGTPQAVIDTLNKAARQAVANPKVLKRFSELATVPATDEELKPEYMKAFVDAEIKRYRELLTN
ncbi:Bordetella uptake gene [Rhabdaerophilaceae bacterium]